MIFTIYLQKLYLLCLLSSISGGSETRSLKKLFTRLDWYEIFFYLRENEMKGLFIDDGTRVVLSIRGSETTFID